MAAMAHVQPVGGVAGPDVMIPNDRRHADIADYGIVHYPLQPLRDPPVQVILPDVRIAQDIPALGRPNAPENQEYDIPDFAPRRIQLFPAHQNPAPRQPAAEIFQILADRHAGIVDYRPQPLYVPPVPYIYPDVEIPQDIPALGRPNALDNQEHDVFDFVQHIPPFPAQAAFYDPFVHQIPAPGHPAAENLRIQADRFLHHRNSQVNQIFMDPSAAGLCRVVIVLELAGIL